MATGDVQLQNPDCAEDSHVLAANDTVAISFLGNWHGRDIATMHKSLRQICRYCCLNSGGRLANGCKRLAQGANTAYTRNNSTIGITCRLYYLSLNIQHPFIGQPGSANFLGNLCGDPASG